ncbi:YusW family protein [Bacillus sp. OK048]|uniref:YusW family protein n=1 Tax=Bacillus sp. OK048 TaxID=1882761 RepID=UPI0008804A72|nr:YusW family protein [Bacillus sp. OK048]SDN64940.1 YusW-like protein [Bacillus sp. OK048]
MKRILYIFLSVFCIVLLTACGDQTNETDNNTDQKNVTQNNIGKTTNVNYSNNLQNIQVQYEMKSQLEKLDFTEIDLKVSYGEQKEYEAKINHDNSGFIGGEVDDEINNEHLSGEAAFDSIYPKVKKLTISKDTNKKDAINQILNSFDLPADYTQFMCEIIFNNGTELKYVD